MPADATPPRKRGCLFYGCLTLVIVGLLGLVGAYVAYRATIRFVNNAVETYTADAPVPIDTVSYPPEKLQALEARIASFEKTLRDGSAQEELVLVADDLNALIARTKELRGRLLVQIDGDKVKGRVSWPLRDWWKLKLNGRYLNGDAVFKVNLADGRLAVTVDDVQVSGKSLPDVILKELKKENLAKKLETEPQAREAIARFESVTVRDGMVVLKNKPRPPATQP
jgi:hypothetical protein